MALGLHDILGLLFFFLSTVVRGHVLSLYTTGASMDGVGWLVCLLWASAGPQKESTPSVGVIHREDGTTRQGFFPWQEARVERTHISHQLKGAADSRPTSVRVIHRRQYDDKDAFLGRQPVLNRTHLRARRVLSRLTMYFC
jgi:hypothetical protein